MEFATEKQNRLAEAQAEYARATNHLEVQIAALSATFDDMLAVQKAAQALSEAEALRVCFECEQGCEAPKQWTQLYRDLEGENAHLRAQATEKDTTNEALQKQVAELQEQLKLAAHKYEGSLIDLANSEKRTGKANEEVDDLKDALTNAQNELEGTAEWLGALRQEIAQMNAALDETLTTIDSLREAHLQAQKALEDEQTALKSANQTIAELEAKLAAANELSEQRRVFAERCQKANEMLSIHNQELRGKLNQESAV
jgi:chromosome segregation ATPase